MSVTDPNGVQYKIAYAIGENKYKVIRSSDGKDFTMKEVSSQSKQETKKVLNEIRIIQKIQGDCQIIPCIVSYFFKDKTWYIISGYIDGEPLSDAKFSGKVCESLFLTLILDLIYIHSYGITHLNITPQNILVTPDLRVYFTGFDMACERKLGYCNPPLNISQYSAPEFSDPDYKYVRKGSILSDVFSLGVVMYECISGKEFFISSSGKQNIKKARRWLFRDSPVFWHSIISQMISYNPLYRPSPDIILEEEENKQLSSNSSIYNRNMISYKDLNIVSHVNVNIPNYDVKNKFILDVLKTESGKELAEADFKLVLALYLIQDNFPVEDESEFSDNTSMFFNLLSDLNIRLPGNTSKLIGIVLETLNSMVNYDESQVQVFSTDDNYDSGADVDIELITRVNKVAINYPDLNHVLKVQDLSF